MRLAMDRLRRYVCAFTDVLAMESTTEKCVDGVPVSAIETDEDVGDGMVAVGAPRSAVDFELLRAEGLDRGIFEVIEARRR